jgi:hypothetical protein
VSGVEQQDNKKFLGGKDGKINQFIEDVCKELTQLHHDLMTTNNSKTFLRP